jgi:hypothetical protein
MKTQSLKQKRAKGLRVGPNGMCEAFLFEFVAVQSSSEICSVASRLVAASSLLDAAVYMNAHEPEFRIQAITNRGLMTLVSGSPYA